MVFLLQLLTGKLYPAPTTKYALHVYSNMPSSPDSSSDSSSSSPQNPYDGNCTTNVSAEQMLPGVIMAARHTYVQFLFKLADLGMSLNHATLITNSLNLLKIMPADQETVSLRLRECLVSER